MNNCATCSLFQANLAAFLIKPTYTIHGPQDYAALKSATVCNRWPGLSEDLEARARPRRSLGSFASGGVVVAARKDGPIRGARPRRSALSHDMAMASSRQRARTRPPLDIATRRRWRRRWGWDPAATVGRP